MWVVADLMSGRQFGLAWMPVANGLIRLATYGFVAYLIARMAALLARETELATRDALSGLLNRRAFFDAGAIEASRAKRYGRPLAVVFIDLDRFKQLNDTRGHDAGDAALKAVAEALRKSLRATDAVGRVGGDEFAILLPEVNLSSATETANKVGAAIAAALSDFQPVSASMGVAWFDSVENDFPALIKAADVLMYEIKQEGKGGIRVRSCAAGASGKSAL
jgi:diguanylate cyclase (GGDEF)-like protein